MSSGTPLPAAKSGEGQTGSFCGLSAVSRMWTRHPGPAHRLGLGAQQDLPGCTRHLSRGDQGFLDDPVRVDDPRHQSQGQRLGRLHHPARHAQVAGDGTAHQVVERPVDHVAEGLLGVGEAGGGGRDPDIAHHGQVEPAGQGGGAKWTYMFEKLNAALAQ